ncbi:MAG: universal stress protein [Burkholderiales bacterium]
MTGYKTIVVHLGRDERRAERLELAFSLAARFDSHLVGLFALSPVYIPGFALAQAGDKILEAQERFRSEAERGATEAFRAAAARHPGVKTEWRSSGDEALEALRISARYADLVIVGQRDRDSEGDTGIAPGFVDELILSAARPVLAVPYAGRFPSVGKRILVAWNASSEAARAVTDALPLLAGADSVQVMAFNPEAGGAEHGESPGADIALFLARHGVKATASRQGHAGADVGEQILSRAADLSIDLIVMGAYGHSRLRELVMGGVTRTLLDSMTVPVLMSR